LTHRNSRFEVNGLHAGEDAQQAAVDREDWRGRVAQCVFDTG